MAFEIISSIVIIKKLFIIAFSTLLLVKRLRPQKISRKQEKKKKQNCRRMVEYKLIETAAVGIVTLTALNLLVKALSHLYKTFLRPAKNFKKYGKWAVVTGATGKK